MNQNSGISGFARGFSTKSGDSPSELSLDFDTEEIKNSSSNLKLKSYLFIL